MKRVFTVEDFDAISRSEKLEWLKNAQDAYYNTTDDVTPFIDDYTYDQIANKYPELITSIGSAIPDGGLPKIKHKKKLYSMDNVYTDEDLMKWVDKTIKLAKKLSSE